jgi:hypothetical protein
VCRALRSLIAIARKEFPRQLPRFAGPEVTVDTRLGMSLLGCMQVLTFLDEIAHLVRCTLGTTEYIDIRLRLPMVSVFEGQRAGCSVVTPALTLQYCLAVTLQAFSRCTTDYRGPSTGNVSVRCKGRSAGTYA